MQGCKGSRLKLYTVCSTKCSLFKGTYPSWSAIFLARAYFFLGSVSLSSTNKLTKSWNSCPRGRSASAFTGLYSAESIEIVHTVHCNKNKHLFGGRMLKLLSSFPSSNILSLRVFFSAVMRTKLCCKESIYNIHDIFLSHAFLHRNTAVWSKVPPLTACCLSPLPGFESQLGHVRKLPVTWG